MSFLFPAFLVGALAIAIPIILHLIKGEVAPKLPFSDIRFLKRAPVTHARRRYLRELLLLALRIAALLLLTVAFARPFFDAGGTLSRGVTVVAVDRSFSMSAPGQFARAQVMAREVVTGSPIGHLVGLVAFDDQAEVIQEPTLGRGLVTTAIGTLTPGAGATRFSAALAAAVEMIGARDGRVVVVSDLQRSGWDVADATVPANVTVEVLGVRAALANLAVTAVDRGPTGVVAVVLNTAASSRQTTVTVRLGSEVIDTVNLAVSPGSSDVAFELDVPPTGTLVVAVDDAEGFAADDRRYFLLDPAEPARLAIVRNEGRSSPATFYLERALLADEEARPFEVLLLAPGELSESTADGLEGIAAVLLLGTDGLERQGRELIAGFLELGGGLLIVGGPTLDTLLVADVLGRATSVELAGVESDGEMSFSVTDARHPIFRSFGELLGTLEHVRFHQTLRLNETGVDAGAVRVLARFDDSSVALAEYDVPPGRAIVFASDLGNAWNNFPRLPTFVPFVHEVVRYLVGEHERSFQMLIADTPDGIRPEPGIVTDPATGRPVALNVDPRESNPSAITTEAFHAHIGAASADGAMVREQTGAAAREAEQSYWWYALFIMLILLVAEAWLGRTIAA